eukprot:EG_transcript_2870
MKDSPPLHLLTSGQFKPEAYSIWLEHCAQHHLFHELQQIWQRIRSLGLHPSTQAITAALTAWGEAGRLDDLEQAWYTSVDRSYRPPAGVVLTAVKACGAAGDPERAARLLNSLLLRGVPAEGEVVAALVQTFGRLQKWDSLWDFVSNVPQDMALAVQLDVLDALLAQGHVPHVGRLLHCMQGAAVGPPPEVFDHLLAVVAAAAEPDVAVRLLGTCLEGGVVPSQHTCDALLTACSELSHTDCLLEALLQLQKHGLWPSVSQFTMLVRDCGGRGGPPELRRGLQHASVAVLRQADRAREAVSLLRACAAGAVPLPRRAWEALAAPIAAEVLETVSACHLDDLDGMLDHFQRQGQPNATAGLLALFCHRQAWETFDQLLAKLEARGLSVTPAQAWRLSEMHAAAGQPAAAAQAAAVLARHGYGADPPAPLPTPKFPLVDLLPAEGTEQDRWRAAFEQIRAAVGAEAAQKVAAILQRAALVPPGCGPGMEVEAAVGSQLRPADKAFIPCSTGLRLPDAEVPQWWRLPCRPPPSHVLWAASLLPVPLLAPASWLPIGYAAAWAATLLPLAPATLLSRRAVGRPRELWDDLASVYGAGWNSRRAGPATPPIDSLPTPASPLSSREQKGQQRQRWLQREERRQRRRQQKREREQEWREWREHQVERRRRQRRRQLQRRKSSAPPPPVPALRPPVAELLPLLAGVGFLRLRPWGRPAGQVFSAASWQAHRKVYGRRMKLSAPERKRPPRHAASPSAPRHKAPSALANGGTPPAPPAHINSAGQPSPTTEAEHTDSPAFSYNGSHLVNGSSYLSAGSGSTVPQGVCP